MIAMLEAVAIANPDAVAVESPGECLTYRALWQAVCRLRSKIESVEATSRPVAVLLPAGGAYVVAVFAVLAARRICLLLDHGYPGDRNAAIAAAAGVDLVLTREGAGGEFAWPGVVRMATEDAFDIAIPAIPPTHAPLALDEPAYILCTSGSTGLPKSIVHSQRTLLHWVRTVVDATHLTPEDRALTIASPSTLAGLVPLLACPLTGASTQMLDIRSVGFGDFLDVLATRPVSILRVAPSFVRALARVPGAASAATNLRLVQLSGEPVLKTDITEIRKFLPPHCLIRSTYGSTEASGLSWFAGEPDDFDPLRSSTGVLMPDTSAMIVDDDGRACAVGEAGELIIRSRYNSLGEWKDGNIESTMFDPDLSDGSARAYRTGDIARFHPEGVFVVLGRKGRMLKINGQRVEPAEVDAVLRRSHEIAEVEVLGHGRTDAIRMIAFVVPRAGAAPNLANRLIADLRTVLPRFMVPSRILVLPAMPRLPGGKVDGQQLLSLADECHEPPGRAP